MALELVTGFQGKNHITAEQLADFNRGIFGDAARLMVGNKMEVEVQTANQITVKDGVALLDGRQIYIGYGQSENISIKSGTQDMKRNDLVVVQYKREEENGVESVKFEVVTGNPVNSSPQDPSINNMDIRTGVFISQKPFCRVRINGTAIEGIDMLIDIKSGSSAGSFLIASSPTVTIGTQTSTITVNYNCPTIPKMIIPVADGGAPFMCSALSWGNKEAKINVRAVEELTNRRILLLIIC